MACVGAKTSIYSGNPKEIKQNKRAVCTISAG